MTESCQEFFYKGQAFYVEAMFTGWSFTVFTDCKSGIFESAPLYEDALAARRAAKQMIDDQARKARLSEIRRLESGRRSKKRKKGKS